MSPSGIKLPEEWADEVPEHFIGDRKDRELFASMFAACQRETIEACAHEAQLERATQEEIVARGKGEWPKPGYIRDDDWLGMRRAIATSEAIEKRIRALVTP